MQAEHVINTLETYGISSQVGYFTSDNASSNDKLLNCLATRLKDTHGIDFDPISRRIRCSGHIINLSLQAFLFANNKEALETVSSLADTPDEVNMVLELENAIRHRPSKRSKAAERGMEAGWRSIGPLGTNL